jgi:glycosyltransferase involved in cell wall biosynthesis
MLSILIPTYNYNVYPLVLELHKQCLECQIEFEILVQDDASKSELNVENEKINLLSNCHFFYNQTNLGRGRNINSIAGKSLYDWILILDCDTFPAKNNFIFTYITKIKNSTSKLFFGGISYDSKKPNDEELLRWIYGRQRESKSVVERSKNPNLTLTSNLLVAKSIFIENPFNFNIKAYGYEDLVFLSSLEKKDYIVKHIDNPTLHLNLETSLIFLNKTKIALQNLKLIQESNDILSFSTKMLEAHQQIKSFKLVFLVTFIFKIFQKRIEKNLISKKPSLFLFDLYKLGYYCSLK